LRKKEFTSFDVTAVVRELNTMINYSRVSNIYQLDPKTFLFKLHKPDTQPLNLIMESSRRLHCTSYCAEKPETPPAFCMALRSRLRNARLEKIEQHEFERVVLLGFRAGEDEVSLVLELFGDGNMIIVGGRGEILHALTYKRMRDRNILRGEPFSFAPSTSRNPFGIKEKEFANTLKSAGDAEIVRALTRGFGVGGIYSEEILLRAGVDKIRKTSSLGEDEIGAVFRELERLLRQAREGKLEPCIVFDETGSFTDVLPLRLRVYAEQRFKLQPYPSFDEALDEFYARATAVQKATAGVEVDELKREAERLGRIIREQEETVAEAEKEASEDKQRGDLIYTHSAEIQGLLDKFAMAKQKGESIKAIAQTIISEAKAGRGGDGALEAFDANRMLAMIMIDGVEVVLNVRKNLFENAGDYYEKSKRAKQKIAGAGAALGETKGKLAVIEEKIRRAEMVEQAKPTEAIEALAASKIKRREWFEKFRWFRSSNGFLVVAGKDAVSNEVLIKKYTEPEDIVFHADVVGAPFVVAKTGGKQPLEQVINEAAEFAAAFSRGWREGFASIDVYWVKPEQLTKTPPSGEFVPHGAFIVTGKRNWKRNTPLTTAIGVIVNKDGEIEFVGGPTEVAKARTMTYVTLTPGDGEGKDLLKKIINALAEQLPKEQKEKARRASIEEIREFVPYGSGRIIQK
jgi:predicted ribosome quality control (RQC) complex YloA/Tae2 family protein